MKKFNHLVKETGFLSEEGRQFLEPFQSALQKILYSPELRELSDQEIKILGSILISQVNDAISKKSQHKTETIKQFQNMSDAEFELYLKNKYGKNWASTSLTDEEFERLPNLSPETIKATIEKGRQAAKAYYEHSSYFPKSNPRFR